MSMGSKTVLFFGEDFHVVDNDGLADAASL